MRILAICLGGGLAAAMAAGLALAQPRGEAPAPPAWVPSRAFQASVGEAIFRAACAGCHMPDGRGATGAEAGAGSYPALANNPRLEAAAYPTTWVVRGRKAMPSMGAFLTDAQVAAVVTYIRTHFGNAYRDPVRAEDVAPLR